jgi:hypothetical protein
MELCFRMIPWTRATLGQVVVDDLDPLFLQRERSSGEMPWAG